MPGKKPSPNAPPDTPKVDGGIVGVPGFCCGVEVILEPPASAWVGPVSIVAPKASGVPVRVGSLDGRVSVGVLTSASLSPGAVAPAGCRNVTTTFSPLVAADGSSANRLAVPTANCSFPFSGLEGTLTPGTPLEVAAPQPASASAATAGPMRYERLRFTML